MLLNGWKEIANHAGRGVRTVQRWERLGFPVRRINKSFRSPVIARSEEIDDWLVRGDERISVDAHLLIEVAKARRAQLTKRADALKQKIAELTRKAEELRDRRSRLFA